MHILSQGIRHGGLDLSLSSTLSSLSLLAPCCDVPYDADANVGDNLFGFRLLEAFDWASLFSFSALRELTAASWKSLLKLTRTPSFLEGAILAKVIPISKIF